MNASPGPQPDIHQAIIDIGLSLLETGLVVDTHGNVSTRDGDHMIITPSGRDYRLLTTDDLVRVELTSGTADGRRIRVTATISFNSCRFSARVDCW